MMKTQTPELHGHRIDGILDPSGQHNYFHNFFKLCKVIASCHSGETQQDARNLSHPISWQRCLACLDARTQEHGLRISALNALCEISQYRYTCGLRGGLEDIVKS